MPGSCAGEQKIGHVGACDQEHESDRSEHHQQRRPEIAGNLLLQGNDVHAPALVELRIVLLQPFCDAGHFGAGLREAYPGLQAGGRDHVTTAGLSIIPALVQTKRNPKLRAVAEELEASRHHADDGVDVSAQVDGTTHDIGIAAEPPLPQPLAQENHWRPIGQILLRRECAPEHRVDAEHRKQVGGDCLAAELLRLTRPDQIQASIPKSRHSFKDGVLNLPVQEISGRHHVSCVPPVGI